MSETNTTKNVRDDEIDLLDLFRRIGRRIGRLGESLGKGFLISIVFLIRNWLPLGLSVALGIGASYISKNATESYYTSDLVLKTNTIPASDLISYFNRLHVYCIEQNKNALGKAISVTAQQVNNIIDISAFWIIDQGNDNIADLVDYEDKHDIYDTVNVRMQDRVNIRVRIKEPLELTNVKDGLINFVKSDSLFQLRNRIILRQNRELIARLSYDIIQLDSLQKVKYFEETRSRQPQNGGQMIFLQEQRTQLVYEDIYSLYERKQNLELQYDLYEEIVTVLSDFSLPANRDNGVFYYGKIIIPLFFFITLMILILIYNRKNLRDIYHRY